MIPGKEVAMSDNVLIDTSVWIQFFNKKGSPVSEKVREYLRRNVACYTGPIVVELLQGAKTVKEIKVIEELFNAMTYVEINRPHYVQAGFVCQKAARDGRTFSVVDTVLAVLANSENLTLFSLDKHFAEIIRYCPFSLIIP